MKQSWQAQEYIDDASFVATMGEPVVALLNPKAFERILDLGCGDGALTAKLATQCAEVYGVDASADMVSMAHTRGLSAHVCRGESLDFEQEFDAVFSNAALHWMQDYTQVIDGVHRALKPCGRFVGEFGGYGCVAKIVEAMEQVFAQNEAFGDFVNPWFFPSVEVYQKALHEGGFDVESVALIERPTPLKAGVEAWLRVFSKGITHHLSEIQVTEFIAQTTALLEPQLYTQDSGWVADYMRLRFYAKKR